MTMRELAKLANVSVSSVSKAFCDASDISTQTKEHIFRIAKQHGCYGKYYKGRYHKRIIAVICPELKSSFYTAYVERLQALIEASGGMCVISTDDFLSAKQEELVEYYASYLKVDGMIVFGLRSKLKKGHETPIVSLFSSEDSYVDSVNVDMHTAINEAVKTMVQYDHRHIAFLGEKLTGPKAAYYEDAASLYRLQSHPVIQSQLRFEEAGEDCVLQLSEQGLLRSITALICAYDNIALGAIRQLKKMGYRVPEDISVIGIDNIHIGGYTETTLTSIDTEPEEVCRIAWDLLQKKMDSPYFKANQAILIRPKLIIRESLCQRNNQEKEDPQ